MEQIITKLKELKLDDKYLERSRQDIIKALENKIPMPCDDTDLYVLSMVIPGALEPEKVAHFEKMVALNKTWYGHIYLELINLINKLLRLGARPVFKVRAKLERLYELLVKKVNPIIEIFRNLWHRLGF